LSFGPKLEPLPATVPPGGEAIATLSFTPKTENFSQEAEIFLEEPDGTRTVTVVARSP
jgi:hypothetical protein